MLSNLPEALEVHRAAWLILTKNGNFNQRNVCARNKIRTELHALYHLVFGRIYVKTKKGLGYNYVFRNCIFKGSPLLGHLIGLLNCILFGKNIGRMIVNKI